MTPSKNQMNSGIQFIAEYCAERPLVQKLLLAPNLRVGNQWRERVAWAGIGTVNLQSATVRSLVLRMTQAWLLENDMRLASSAISELLIHKSIVELNNDGKLNYFGVVTAKDKLAKLMARSISDLRMAGLDSHSVPRGQFETPEKAKDVVAVMRRYESELSHLALADYSDCLRFINGHLKGIMFDEDIDFRCILAFELDLTPLERQFLEHLKRLGVLSEQPSKELTPLDAIKQRHASGDLSIRVHVTCGEVNEVRRLLQDVLANGKALDQVEVLHTDYHSYVPLVHELLVALQLKDGDQKLDSVEAIPATFAEGIGCIYSRTGRALRSWVRWLRNDCLQSSLVQMFREGLLFVRDSEAVRGYSYLASTLQKLSIGLHGDRYLPKIDEAIQVALQSKKERDEEDGESEEGQARYDYGLGALNALRNTIEPILKNAPALDSPPRDVLQAAIRFLKYDARRESMLDKYVRKKLIEDIEAFGASLEVYPGLDVNVWEWLEALPLDARVLASGPLPGKMHVDMIGRGGHSGRPEVYVLGLDDTRFPPRGGQDPLVLDRERKRISSTLRTSDSKSARCVEQFQQAVANGEQRVTLSFSERSLAEDAEQFASSVLIDLIRELDIDAEKSEEELSRDATTFSDWNLPMLNMDDWWFHRQIASAEAAKRQSILEEYHPQFKDKRVAVEAISSARFGGFDGLVPAAGVALDPTREDANRMSASRLETFGKCPRKFFFRYGLGIDAPDELIIDPDRWLTPMAFGTLLHGVFETFLRELTSTEQVPKFTRDLPRLQELLHLSVDEYRTNYPIPNEDAYQRQVAELEKCIEIYLREDERYCRETGARPWVFEAALGVGGELPETEVSCSEPQPVTLSDGRVLKMRGLIDRIDRVEVDGSTFCNIWDYKSGSTYGYSQEKPFQEGRKLQPFLYVGMLRHRLGKTTSGAVDVRQFGYFFPNPRANQVHLQWTRGELKTGDQVLRHICDLIATGSFVATNDKNDCTYCDYLPICGEPVSTATNTNSMLAEAANVSLSPFAELRPANGEDK